MLEDIMKTKTKEEEVLNDKSLSKKLPEERNFISNSNPTAADPETLVIEAPDSDLISAEQSVDSTLNYLRRRKDAFSKDHKKDSRV